MRDEGGIEFHLRFFGKDTDVDVIVGTESRGFMFGVPIAYNLHKPFVPVRKKGKLPCETVSRSYDLEYGSATIEMHRDLHQTGTEGCGN